MQKSSQFSLLRQRRFGPFFWTQFFGAFNDNVFKTALLTIITYDALNWTTLDPSLLNNLIPGLFILPFLLFSATSGQLAEKFEKAGLARFVKLLEIAIMAVAALGWLWHELWILVAAVVGMGLHSTLFGPVKYAYLPQHLKSNELIGGNGVVEMGTFVGILLGEVFGALLVMQKPWGIELIVFSTLAFAVIGWLFSRRIPHSPAAAPELRINWNPFTESVRNLAYTRQNRPVFLSVVGNSWFWFYGAVILAQFPVYAKDYLRGDHSVFVLLLTVFSLGIGVGSLLCEKFSGHKVEIGLVPFGAIGLSVFGAELYFASLGYAGTAQVDAGAFLTQAGSARILIDIVMLGMFGGFYIVPLFAVIQTRCDPTHVSRTIAGMNIMNALFMVVAALFAMVLLSAGFTIPQLFLATAVLNLFVAIYIFSQLPEFLMRFLAWLLMNTIHRVRTDGVERIPEKGAAILVCNHVSHVDAIVILAASPRPIRFVMDDRLFRIPFLSWIFRAARAIPILPPIEEHQRMESAFVDIAQALHDGDLVCIFLEGNRAPTEGLDAFKGSIGKLLACTPVPVIPMALRGRWGSLFSRNPSNPFQRSFRRGLFSRLLLAVGTPLAAAATTPGTLYDEVRTLRGDRQ